jgi:hypothetical protein
MVSVMLIAGTDMFNEKAVTYLFIQDTSIKLDLVTIQTEDMLESKYVGVRTTASVVALLKNGNLFLRKIGKIIKFRPRAISRAYRFIKRVLPRLMLFIRKPNYINFEAFVISYLTFIVVNFIFSIIFRITVLILFSILPLNFLFCL